MAREEPLVTLPVSSLVFRGIRKGRKPIIVKIGKTHSTIHQKGLLAVLMDRRRRVAYLGQDEGRSVVEIVPQGFEEPVIAVKRYFQRIARVIWGMDGEFVEVEKGPFGFKVVMDVPYEALKGLVGMLEREGKDVPYSFHMLFEGGVPREEKLHVLYTYLRTHTLEAPQRIVEDILRHGTDVGEMKSLLKTLGQRLKWMERTLSVSTDPRKALSDLRAYARKRNALFEQNLLAKYGDPERLLWELGVTRSVLRLTLSALNDTQGNHARHGL